MMVRVKICGLRNPEDAAAAAKLGADAIGLVFAPSKRRVDAETAREIVAQLPPFVMVVGVFVNEQIDEVNRIVDYVGLDLVQLHGDEDIAYIDKVRCKVIKAIPVKSGFQAKLASYQGHVIGFLLDTYLPGQPGGTGQSFDWSAAAMAAELGPIVLAGGLNPENVVEAIRVASPFGVDVSSGVETDGVKDLEKIHHFIEAVRRYNHEGIA